MRITRTGLVEQLSDDLLAIQQRGGHRNGIENSDISLVGFTDRGHAPQFFRKRVAQCRCGPGSPSSTKHISNITTYITVR